MEVPNVPLAEDTVGGTREEALWQGGEAVALKGTSAWRKLDTPLLLSH